MLRLDYARGPGAETCPADPAGLRADIARYTGYGPFDQAEGTGPERLAVTLSRQGRGFAARIERCDASGALTWSETFSGGGRTCASFVSLLATEIRAPLLTFQGPPVSPPASPPARQRAQTQNHRARFRGVESAGRHVAWSV